VANKKDPFNFFKFSLSAFVYLSYTHARTCTHTHTWTHTRTASLFSLSFTNIFICDHLELKQPW